MMIEVLGEFPAFTHLAERAELRDISAETYYGPDYQDVGYRVPDITSAREILGWEPKIDLREALRRTISAYVRNRQIVVEELGRPDEL
ncbi:MAG: hypothetical protein C4B57_11700 [Deltaproteobacteria bacterium]|nr:MAG: hypothetical protein C4B57_11700 [Deltaproteobacteria bacterium]